MCSPDVKALLIKTYCCNLYCCSLWTNYKKCTMLSIKTAYKKMFRLVMQVKPGNTTTSMVKYNVFNFETILRNCTYGFRERILKSENVLVCAVTSSVYFIQSATAKVWHCRLF